MDLIQHIYSLIQDLNSKFSLKDLGELSFFLGIKAHRNQCGLLLTQTKYAAELLQKTQIQDSKPCKTLIAANTKLFMGDNENY